MPHVWDSEERHRAILQTAMDGFWLVGPDGHLQDVNESYCRMSGYTRDELLTMRVADLEACESLEETLTHVRKVLNEGQDRFETRHRKKDGSIVQVEISAQSREGMLVVFIHDITQRKQAEAVLRASEANYRALLEGLPDIVTRRDLAGRILFISANATRMVNMRPEQFIGKTSRELGFPEEHCRIIDDAIASVLAANAPFETEMTFASPTGKRVLNTRLLPERDGHGVIRSLLSIARDVTAQHEAERALRESEQRHRTILQTALEGYWRVGADGQLLEVNDAYCRMSGYSREELLAKRIGELKAPGTEHEAERNYLHTLRLGPQRFESVHRAKDGSLFVIEACTAGQVDGTVVGFMRDITDKRRAEEDLRASRERYRNILETAIDGFWVVDTDGRILEVNDTYCRMIGYSREELLAMRARDVDADGQVPARITERLAALRAEGEGRFERAQRRKDGSVFPVEVSTQYREGVFLAFIRDITVQQEVERSRQEAVLKAEAASVAKSRFLANMSHEIRTPLNGVLGMARQLLGTSLSAEQSHFATVLEASAKALLNVISDILDFSKIEAGRMEIDPVDFDLRTVFADTAALLTFAARDKGLDLRVAIAPELPTVLRGDQTRLRQVLINLASNAVKFTERGSVWLSAMRESETPTEVTVRFEVRDTGMGIADDKVAALFEEFQQGDTSITRKFGGSGLGLAISRGLVGLMRGDIGVERRVDGSTFWFTAVFARTREKTPLARRATEATVRPGLRVLLAEDDHINQLVANALLAKLGCEVEVVANGLEAVARVAGAGHRTPHDLVLMDVQMPVMDGLEAARELRRLGARVPVIALTAHASQEARDECLAAGMDDYLSKPIEPEALARLLAAWQPQKLP